MACSTFAHVVICRFSGTKRNAEAIPVFAYIHRALGRGRVKSYEDALLSIHDSMNCTLLIPPDTNLMARPAYNIYSRLTINKTRWALRDRTHHVDRAKRLVRHGMGARWSGWTPYAEIQATKQHTQENVRTKTFSSDRNRS